VRFTRAHARESRLTSRLPAARDVVRTMTQASQASCLFPGCEHSDLPPRQCTGCDCQGVCHHFCCAEWYHARGLTDPDDNAAYCYECLSEEVFADRPELFAMCPSPRPSRAASPSLLIDVDAAGPDAVPTDAAAADSAAAAAGDSQARGMMKRHSGDGGGPALTCARV